MQLPELEIEVSIAQRQHLTDTQTTGDGQQQRHSPLGRRSIQVGVDLPWRHRLWLSRARSGVPAPRSVAGEDAIKPSVTASENTDTNSS